MCMPCFHSFMWSSMTQTLYIFLFLCYECGDLCPLSPAEASQLIPSRKYEQKQKFLSAGNFDLITLPIDIFLPSI